MNSLCCRAGPCDQPANCIAKGNCQYKSSSEERAEKLTATETIVRNAYNEGVQDFFSLMADAANEKDIRDNGPNPPLTLRSLHDTKLTMNEILLIKNRLISD